MDLRENIKRAISEKLEEEQKALKMEFTLARERQEAERKRIEAQGIADFQKIVATGISPELLRWKGIEATEKLASSGQRQGGGDRVSEGGPTPHPRRQLASVFSR